MCEGVLYTLNAQCIQHTIIRHYQSKLALYPESESPNPFTLSAPSNGLPGRAGCVSDFDLEANIDLGSAL